MTDERALSLKFGIKPSTYASYRQSYDNHVKETLGNRKIKSFRHSDILEFYSRLVKKGLSIKTVKHIHTQLASAFTLACPDPLTLIFTVYKEEAYVLSVRPDPDDPYKLFS